MNLRVICKSKIHHGTVTGADPTYVGSIGIDRHLMDLTNIVPGEQVAVWNVTNGKRIETYAIPLPAMSCQIVVNGAAARHFQKGDCVIVAAFAVTDEAVTPRMIQIDQNNQLIRDLGSHDPDVESSAGPETFRALHDDRTPTGSASR